MNLSRRRLFGFGAALVAAPAVVRVSALMPISVPRKTMEQLLAERLAAAEATVEEEIRRCLRLTPMRYPPNFGLAVLVNQPAPVLVGIDRSADSTTYRWKNRFAA